MSQNKSTRTKCGKKKKYRDLKMGFSKLQQYAVDANVLKTGQVIEPKKKENWTDN